MKIQGVEAIHIDDFHINDLEIVPDRFHGSPMLFMWNWFVKSCEDDTPVFYLRELTADITNDNGIIHVADTTTSKHKPIVKDILQMVQSGTKVEYRKVKGDPEGWTNDPYTFEQRIDGKLLCRYSSRYAHIIEEGIMDIKMEFFPWILAMYEEGALTVPYLHRHGLVTGTLHGEEIYCIGGQDRMFAADVDGALSGKIFTGMTFGGIHKNGIREWGFIGMIGKNQSVGFYCKDGEEPVISEDVKFYGEWAPLEYVDDGTLANTRAIYEFGGKHIVYEGKWGYRSQGIEPKDRPGLSQTTGIWYEGETPADFKTSFVYAECQNAFREMIPENTLPAPVK